MLIQNVFLQFLLLQMIYYPRQGELYNKKMTREIVKQDAIGSLYQKCNIPTALKKKKRLIILCNTLNYGTKVEPIEGSSV